MTKMAKHTILGTGAASLLGEEFEFRYHAVEFVDEWT
jgi:hypothetical protein